MFDGEEKLIAVKYELKQRKKVQNKGWVAQENLRYFSIPQPRSLVDVGNRNIKDLRTGSVVLSGANM